jgi:N-acetylneuraminic acid mutarotase
MEQGRRLVDPPKSAEAKSTVRPNAPQAAAEEVKSIMATRISLATLLLLAIGSSTFAQTWEPAASMPGLGRHHPVNFSLNGFGYAATGTTTQFGATDDFYRYDPIADAWAVLPDFPGTDRSFSYGGAFNGKGYLGFGYGGGYLADLWQYDPITGQWTQLASLPASGRMHPAFVITDEGKIFVGMGNAATNFRDWWEYDIATNVWTRKADLPGGARHHPFYFNIGKYPYVGFGHGTVAYKDLYRFDPDSGLWTRMQDFPGEARLAGTQLTYNGEGFILSGDGSDEQQLDTGEFWEYFPAQDRWASLPPHPGSGRWAPGNFLIGQTLYCMAGESTVQLEHDMWKFDMARVAAIDDLTLETDLSFTLSPNPVTGRLLRLNGLSTSRGISTIQVLGVDGRRIWETEGSSTTLQIPDRLPAGQYFLSVATESGRRHAGRFTVAR